MSDMRIGSAAFFDKGIDSVTYKSGELAQPMPDQQLLTPAERAERPQLETLLAQPNTDSFLDDSICPQLDDRELLLPGKFRQVLESTLSTLTQAAQNHQSANADSTKALNRAVRLLNEEVGLRDLLQMYRSALYQG
jgi:type III secretion protein X